MGKTAAHEVSVNWYLRIPIFGKFMIGKHLLKKNCTCYIEKSGNFCVSSVTASPELRIGPSESAPTEDESVEHDGQEADDEISPDIQF